jgi:hypothetical protein
MSDEKALALETPIAEYCIFKELFLKSIKESASRNASEDLSMGRIEKEGKRGG